MFDNVRLAGVGGADRRAVPDGQLCSAGVANFRGLDLARDDFPATAVAGGETLAIRYRTTIPHRGTFRIYLTRAGYDPLKKLTWDDLGSKPIAAVQDPPVRDGSYVMSARLPGRTGRHLLYIVWQNSSTPDTYYSCSDLAFPAAAAPSPAPAPVRTTTKPAAEPTAAVRGTSVRKPSAEPVAARTTATAAPPEAPVLTPLRDESQMTSGHRIIGGALLVAVGAVAYALVGGLRRRRREKR